MVTTFKIYHIKPKVETTHNPGVMSLNSPAKLFIPTKAKDPKAIPAAIENVSGMTSIMQYLVMFQLHHPS